MVRPKRTRNARRKSRWRRSVGKLARAANSNKPRHFFEDEHDSLAVIGGGLDAILCAPLEKFAFIHAVGRIRIIIALRRTITNLEGGRTNARTTRSLTEAKSDIEKNTDSGRSLRKSGDAGSPSLAKKRIARRSVPLNDTSGSEVSFTNLPALFTLSNRR